MKIRFWGTRGSNPAPLGAAGIQDKLCRVISGLPETLNRHDPGAVQDYIHGLPPLLRGTAGGNTACVSVQSGETLVVLDAGTGFRELGLALMSGPFGRGEGTLHLFISHLHWDHIQGFPPFVPAAIPGNRIYIYGFHDLPRGFENQQQPAHWPVPFQALEARIEFVPLALEQPVTIGELQIDALKNQHPGASYSYRVSDRHSVLVYATDVEYKQLDDAAVQRYVHFFRGADVLIFDSQYTLRQSWQREDWGHSSALIGVDLARAAGVRQLLLFHHDPVCSDEELERIWADTRAYQAQNPGPTACEIGLAYEGLELELSPEHQIDLQLAPGGGAAILTSARVFDELSVAMVARQLEGTAGSSILDLSQVETLTTGGMKALVKLRQEQPERAVALVAASERVRAVIRLVGYQDAFAVYPSVEAALKAAAVREAVRLPGHVLGGRYQIEARLDESPLGTLLQGWDLETQQRCGLRLLTSSFGAAAVTRLLQQAPQIVGATHPHWVGVTAWERQGELVYAVEALPEAPTLAQRLAEPGARLVGDAALQLALDLSRALEYAHSRGVVHGDLRPEHIYLTEQGAQVGGFGLGRLAEGWNLLKMPVWLQDPAYLAPEQILGQPVDAAVDLYALGVILYRAFTGQLPFAGTAAEIIEGQLHGTPVRPGDLSGSLSPALEHLILKLLAKNPNERYASPQQTRRISASLMVRDGEVALLPNRRLVAREQPLQVLLECWERARQGVGQLVLICGEPGVGKTTLAQQAARLSGTPVLLMGAGEEREGVPAYALFTQILRSYLVTVPPELGDVPMREWLSPLTGLVPELARMVPGLTPPPPLEPAREQQRLLESLARFIYRATRERPWFVILDDLQWVDQSSLELLRYLIRYLPETALLVVGTYRDGEVGPDHPLRETLRTIAYGTGYRLLILDRLDETEVGILLGELWQQAVPPSLVSLVYRHTAGNPFYVEEVAKSLADEGYVTMKDGQWRFPTDLERIVLPPSVRETVLKRIRLLPEETQGLLRQAAVLGQSFNYLDLREMSGLSEWELLERLDPALERQMVREISGDGQLRFRHFEIYQVLYGELSLLRRRLLHRQAGEALERRAGAAGRRAEELAYHFGQAGDEPKAIAYGLQAARQTHQAYALETAFQWYNQVLTRIKLLPEEQPELELEIHRALGEIAIITNRYLEALGHCAAALSLLPEQPETPERGRQRAALCVMIAQAHERHSNYAAALEWVHKGLGYLGIGNETESPERARLHYLWGAVLLQQSQKPRALVRLKQALKMARSLRLPGVEADCVRTLGVIAWQGRVLDEAEAYFQRALQIGREVGDRQGEGRALNNLGVSTAARRQYEPAEASYRQALTIFYEIGDSSGAGLVLHNLSDIAWMRGNLGEARTLGERALRLHREGEDRRNLALGLVGLARILADCGDYGGARACAEESLAIRRQIGDRRGEGETLHQLGRITLNEGNPAWAYTFLTQALEIAEKLGDPCGKAPVGLALARAEAALGQAERAIATCRTVLDSKAVRESLPYLRFPAQVDLAGFYWQCGERKPAQAEMEDVLGRLPVTELSGADEPFRIYWLSYRLLWAWEDPRGRPLLNEAVALLHSWAERMDEATRQTFLENVAVNRDLLQWFQGDFQM